MTTSQQSAAPPLVLRLEVGADGLAAALRQLRALTPGDGVAVVVRLVESDPDERRTLLSGLRRASPLRVVEVAGTPVPQADVVVVGSGPDPHAAGSRRWLERVVDTTPDVVAVYDLATDRIVYVNPQIDAILGYSPDEVQGMGDAAAALVHPDDRERFLGFLASLAASNATEAPPAVGELEMRVRHRNGTWRHGHIRAVPFASGEQLQQYLIVGRDITDLKRKEEALRRSEARFRRAVERAPVPMMMQADDGEIVVNSEALLARTGYPADVLRSFDRWTELAYGSRAEEVREAIAAVFRTCRPPPPFELEVRTAWGERRIWLFRISEPELLYDGRHAIVVVAQDLTELRRTQEALTEAARQKDEFIAMLGHELRNPLAAIRAGVDLLGELRPNDHELLRSQRILSRQCAQMAYLVDGLLDISRIARGKLHLERRPVDLARVVEEVAEDRRDSVERRRLRLVCDTGPEPLWVEGDRFRLAQVLDNLLGNAIKFTDPPGVVTVTAGGSPTRVFVTVRDTGAGISKELQAHLFEPFRQGAQDIARSAGGLGLGLALSKGLVELHHGTISAYSEGDGTGATFTITLPRLDAAPEARPDRGAAPHVADVSPEPLTAPTTPAELEVSAERTDSPPHRVQRPGAQPSSDLQVEESAAGEAGRERAADALDILLVEDNLDAAELLRTLLELQGHRVRLAASGDKALEMVHEQAPDLVLCDLGLPGISGYDVARALRAEERYADLPLVALTGYGHDEARRKSKEAGFDLHLVKPVELDELMAAVEQSTQRR